MKGPVKQRYDIFDLFGLIWDGPRKFVWLVPLCLYFCFVRPLQCVNQAFEVGEEVIKRYPSPDGKLAVVLIETNAGATTPFGANLVMTKNGQTPFSKNAFYRSLKYTAYPKVKWISNRQIEVTESGGDVLIKLKEAQLDSFYVPDKIEVSYR